MNERTAAESMQALGISKVDTSELEAICKEIVAANPKIVSDVKGGKQQAVGALVGQADIGYLWGIGNDVAWQLDAI